MNYVEQEIVWWFKRYGKWPDEDSNFDEEIDCPCGDYNYFWESVDRLKKNRS